ADILDEATTNIDDVVRKDEKNSLIRKALRRLATAANGYMNQLAMLKDKTQNEDELAAIERAFDNAKEIADAGGKLPANEPEPRPRTRRKRNPEKEAAIGRRQPAGKSTRLFYRFCLLAPAVCRPPVIPFPSLRLPSLS